MYLDLSEVDNDSLLGRPQELNLSLMGMYTEGIPLEAINIMKV